MRPSALSNIFSIATIFFSLFSTAFADQEGTCFSSIESYWKSLFGENYAEDDNLILKEIEGDENKLYLFAIDNTPSRNPLGNILKKEGYKKLCVIATEIWADGVQFEFSQGGLISKIKTWNFVYNPYLHPKTVITLKPESKGVFSSRECRLMFFFSKKTEIYPCHSEPDIDHLYDQPNLELIPPSFDCRKANSAIEKTICGDAKLALLDSALSFNYKNLTSSIDASKCRQLSRDQRLWLKRRNKCRTTQCIDEFYRSRIDELCKKYPIASGREFECVSSSNFNF